MRWMSVDPAEKTGLVVWEGTTPLLWATLQPMGKREAAKCGFDPAQALALVSSNLESPRAYMGNAVGGYASLLDAWRWLLVDKGAVVCEESFGDSPKTVAQMGERRGYIRCACDRNSGQIPFHTVNTMVWRKVCGERLDKSWPPASKAAKQRSIDLVREHCDGLVVTGDEGDAYWVGRAAMWLGLVTP